MTATEVLENKRTTIKDKLKTVQLPADGTATSICWTIGSYFGVTGTTVLNYIAGEIKDGYLAEAIYNEFKKLKMCK